MYTVTITGWAVGVGMTVKTHKYKAGNVLMCKLDRSCDIYLFTMRLWKYK